MIKYKHFFDTVYYENQLSYVDPRTNYFMRPFRNFLVMDLERLKFEQLILQSTLMKEYYQSSMKLYEFKINVWKMEKTRRAFKDRDLKPLDEVAGRQHSKLMTCL